VRAGQKVKGQTSVLLELVLKNKKQKIVHLFPVVMNLILEE
jgi:hypothetical protein